MKIILFFCCSFLISESCYHLPEKPKKVVQNGMTLEWRIAEGRIWVSMHAPTQGWLAIGFNEQSGLPNTNLIMASVRGEQLVLSDRYVVAVGHHQSIAELGGTPSAEGGSAKETSEGTTIEFSLPLKAKDQYHVDLEEGKKYYVLMAFSREDDFAHHSMMRTEVRLVL
ncbi:MAG: hypothetical protein HC912_05580 [Saprospiraceae bacterium]|nr:hypothetical protein [Saprospiraceae bacterium]